jgi:hypothetical protein
MSSNYPNMSYCAFENTAMAMRQLLNMMREVDSLQELDLSYEEMRAFRELQDLCELFAEGAEALEGDVLGGEQQDYGDNVDEAQEWRDFDPDC